jgi:protein-disulfide isomerase
MPSEAVTALAGKLTAPPLALVAGWWIFLIVVVLIFVAVVYGYYTVRGSGISQTPYNDPTGPPGSPSELAHDITQDVGNWERGTDSGRRRPPPAVRDPIDPTVAEALKEWRRAPASEPRLAPPVGSDDHVRGPAEAITVTVYVDVTSGPSRNAVRLLTSLARQRPLLVAVRHLPLADVHPLALSAAEALEAAGAQGRFFELLDRLSDSNLPDEEALLIAAGECVVDPERLRGEVRAGRYRSRIADQIRQATSSGARGVPEIYIDGEHFGGGVTVDPLTRALDSHGA